MSSSEAHAILVRETETERVMREKLAGYAGFFSPQKREQIKLQHQRVRKAQDQYNAARAYEAAAIVQRGETISSRIYTGAHHWK